MDSSAMIRFFLDRGNQVKGLFIDYGQLALTHEKKAVKAISEYYSIKVDCLKWTLGKKSGQGEIPGRNLILLSAALNHFSFNSGIIALGIHRGTQYADCSLAFIQAVQQVFDIYKDGQIQVEAPFIDMDKGQIWQYCKENKVPLNLTYSCERGENPPCGKCLSCLDKLSFYEFSEE